MSITRGIGDVLRKIISTSRSGSGRWRRADQLVFDSFGSAVPMHAEKKGGNEKTRAVAAYANIINLSDLHNKTQPGRNKRGVPVTGLTGDGGWCAYPAGTGSGHCNVPVSSRRLTVGSLGFFNKEGAS